MLIVICNCFGWLKIELDCCNMYFVVVGLIVVMVVVYVGKFSGFVSNVCIVVGVVCVNIWLVNNVVVIL